jgi:hypothetical protein
VAPSSFPGSLDTLANPAAGDQLSNVTTPHAAQHANVNDIVEAIEAKLGLGASTPGATAAVLRRTGTGSSGWGQTAAGDYGAGSIANADVNGSAAIAYSKLALASSIVSADIVDGTIATGDLAAGSTAAGSTVYGTTVSPTTSTGSAADLLEMTLTPTLVGGGLLLVLFECVFSNSVAGSDTVFDLFVGGSAVLRRELIIRVANEQNYVVMTNVRASVAGSTTVKIQWFLTSGVSTAEGTRRSLTVVELKR